MKIPAPFFLCTLLCLTLSFVACDDDCPDPANPECDNYDPCFGQQEVSAGFTAYEVAPSGFWLDNGWYEPYYKSDTIVRDGYFVAEEENAEYEWHIGGGIYDTREVYLDFISVQINEKVPVTLIVRKTPNLNCFPSDDGVDTFTRLITVIKSSINEYFPRTPKVGETWVFETQDLDNPNEIWQFEYSYFKDDFPQSIPRHYYHNIPKGFQMRRGITSSRNGGVTGAFLLIVEYLIRTFKYKFTQASFGWMVNIMTLK